MPEISYTRVNDNTPVLVGCAQLTDKRGVEGHNYLEILTEVSKKALTITANRVNIKSGLFKVSLNPKAKTKRPSGRRFSSKFLSSFLKIILARIPETITPNPLISVPIPGIISY